MEHSGSRETYDFIADWIAPDFPFSKKDVWHRFGMLGVMGDYILSCTEGDILEIGTGESSIYYTMLAKKYNRRFITCDAAASKIINPMTIPGYLPDGIDYIKESCDCADPGAGNIAYAGTSDSLFTKIKVPPLAIAFIDGDHNYEQVVKDFNNVLLHVVDNGYIFLHDTYPPNEEFTSEHRCGTVYKLRKDLEKKNYPIDIFTFPKGTAMSVGLTMIRKRPSNTPEYQDG